MRKTLLFALLLLLGTTVQLRAQTQVAQNANITYEGATPVGIVGPDNYIAGQIFMPTTSVRLTTISFFVDMFYAPGTVNLEIYSCPSRTAWGTLLGTKTSLPINAPGWRVLDVSSLNINLTAGQYFGFQVKTNTGADFDIAYSSNSYSSGDLWENAVFGTWQRAPSWSLNFRVAGSSVLPAKLGAFTTKPLNGSVLLQWNTLQEVGTKEFVVQHSRDGYQWQALQTVAAAVNSNSNKSYSYLHTHPAKGRNYYRLAMVDQDNSNTYSPVASEDLQAAAKLQVSTTPGTLVLRSSSASPVKIYQMSGALQWSGSIKPGVTQLPVSHWPRGIYVIESEQDKQKVQL